MRCFVALDLPTPVCNHLVKVSAPLRDKYDVRWVPREQMHVTLLFGGELGPDEVDALTDIVDDLELPPIALSLDGFGVFPPKGLPRVVWAGLVGDTEAIRRLQVELTDRAEPLGIQREKRAFTPHVTLGRVQGKFGLLTMIDEMKKLGDGLNPKPFSPPSVTLYESTLTPKGPIYDVILRRELA